jgi:Suppressor of fused protein (SUFU)
VASECPAPGRQGFVKLYDCLFMTLGHTMALSNPPAPLVKGSKLTRFVFLQPPSLLLKGGERLMTQQIEGKKLLALWCTGIAEEEIPLLTRLGDGEFARRLEKHSLVFDPTRPLLRS